MFEKIIKNSGKLFNWENYEKFRKFIFKLQGKNWGKQINLLWEN